MRLNNLEETLAHQEQQISDLSDMLIAQGREMAHMAKEIAKLKAKIESHQEGAGDGGAGNATDFAAQNKPPHW